MKLKFKKPEKRVKKFKIKKKKVEVPMVKCLAKDTEAFVPYLAPSSLVILTREYGDIEPDKEILFKWQCKEVGNDGKVKIAPDYPLVNYTKDIYARVRRNETLRAEFKAEVKAATYAFRERHKRKHTHAEGTPRIKFKIAKRVRGPACGHTPRLKFKMKKKGDK